VAPCCLCTAATAVPRRHRRVRRCAPLPLVPRPLSMLLGAAMLSPPPCAGLGPAAGHRRPSVLGGEPQGGGAPCTAPYPRPAVRGRHATEDASGWRGPGGCGGYGRLRCRGCSLHWWCGCGGAAGIEVWGCILTSHHCPNGEAWVRPRSGDSGEAGYSGGAGTASGVRGTNLRAEAGVANCRRC
jgi:hypothetical protein